VGCHQFCHLLTPQQAPDRLALVAVGKRDPHLDDRIGSGERAFRFVSANDASFIVAPSSRGCDCNERQR
jgi:hypothetical protein